MSKHKLVRKNAVTCTHRPSIGVVCSRLWAFGKIHLFFVCIRSELLVRELWLRAINVLMRLKKVFAEFLCSHYVGKAKGCFTLAGMRKIEIRQKKG